MKVTETMIQAYFRDELGEYEQALIEQHFLSHPELLEQYITEKSWEDFDISEDLDDSTTDKMLKVISSATYKKDNIRRMVYRWSSVAAVLLLVTAGYFLLSGRMEKSARPLVMASTRALNADQEWKTDSNSTEKILHLSLEDGSMVDLSKGSRISYRKHFEPASRNIWLTGSAVFNVGKDKARAFTVYTKGLEVTALGTVFEISASRDEHEGRTTKVRLMSGRVVVTPDSLLAAKGLKPIYLDPGQTLLFDKQLSSMALARPAGGATSHAEHQPMQKPVMFAFNNEPLGNIMDTLCTVYAQKAIYDRELLKEMTFTGSFDSRKETLGSFLGTLAMLYNLSIKQEKNTITITR